MRYLCFVSISVIVLLISGCNSNRSNIVLPEQFSNIHFGDSPESISKKLSIEMVKYNSYNHDQLSYYKTSDLFIVNNYISRATFDFHKNRLYSLSLFTHTKADNGHDLFEYFSNYLNKNYYKFKVKEELDPRRFPLLPYIYHWQKDDDIIILKVDIFTKEQMVAIRFRHGKDHWAGFTQQEGYQEELFYSKYPLDKKVKNSFKYLDDNPQQFPPANPNDYIQSFKNSLKN